MFSQHMHKRNEDLPPVEVIPDVQTQLHPESNDNPVSESSSFWQLHERYILSPMKNGFLVIDQQRAHERVLYEHYIQGIARQQAETQQKLFPDTVEFTPADAQIVESQLTALQSIGFDIHPFGSNTFVVHGIPAGTENFETPQLLEEVIATFKENDQELHLKPLENIARSLARRAAVKPGKHLSAAEMQSLVDELFGCEQPGFCPNGKPVFVNFPIEEIDKRLKRS
jgi:DNA mismatch repair protein MutL